MRIKVEFEMSTDWLVIDYRRIFLSLIKGVITVSDSLLYNQMYGSEEQKRKVNKPFTFSIFFPNFKKIENNKVNCGNKVTILFSSNSEMLLSIFYNGLTKKKNYSIGALNPISFKVQNIFLLPTHKVTNAKVLFKSLSPILVNKVDTDIFLSPTDIEFDAAFKRNIINQANAFNLPCTNEQIVYEIKTMKKLPLTHYQQTMTSWLGEFVLEAPIEVLQLVYDTGIGVRRSQGFGMLEILKQF